MRTFRPKDGSGAAARYAPRLSHAGHTALLNRVAPVTLDGPWVSSFLLSDSASRPPGDLFVWRRDAPLMKFMLTRHVRLRAGSVSTRLIIAVRASETLKIRRPCVWARASTVGEAAAQAKIYANGLHARRLKFRELAFRIAYYSIIKLRCRGSFGGSLPRRDAAVIRMRMTASPAGALPGSVLCGRRPFASPNIQGSATLRGALRACIRQVFLLYTPYTRRIFGLPRRAPMSPSPLHADGSEFVGSWPVCPWGLAPGASPPALDDYIIGGGPYIKCTVLPVR